MKTRVFLVRHGVTDWHVRRKVLGQRDIGLNADGRAQAKATASALAEVAITDILSSPLVRAVETAETISAHFDMQIARDPRLIDFGVGRWEGMTYEEVAAAPEYQQFLANPMAAQIPGGEHVGDIRDRAVGAIEQALTDNPAGDGIVAVTHAGIIRVLLSHYLGSTPANYHRLRVGPGSVSVLEFADDKQLPRVLGVNWQPALTRLL